MALHIFMVSNTVPGVQLFSHAAMTPVDPHSNTACVSDSTAAPVQERMSLPRRRARQALYRKRTSRAQPSLEELLATPSTFKVPQRGETASVTVILNHFKRRTLCRQLDALLAQSAPPAHIWVCLFSSPMTASARAAALAYNDSRIAIFASDHNFKYFGRFQLALAAPTTHVLVIDDDMVPGRSFLATALHVSGTRRAALGSIGWLLPRPHAPPDLRLSSYRSLVNDSGGLYVPDLAYDILVDRLLPVGKRHAPLTSFLINFLRAQLLGCFLQA